MAALALLLLAAPAVAQPAPNVAAQTVTPDSSPPDATSRNLPPAPTTGGIALAVSQGKLVILQQPASSVFIADPAIADIQVANADHVFVFGKKPGHTSLYALGGDGTLLKSLGVDVVNAVGPAQHMANQTVGAGDARVSGTNNGAVLTGHVVDPSAGNLVQKGAADTLPDKSIIDDRLKVRSSVQVTLHVRIAEVSRSITKQLGFNWNALMNSGIFQYGLFTGRTLFNPALGLLATPAGAVTLPGAAFLPATPMQSAGQPGSFIGGINTGSGSINAVIDALAEEGLLTILAEPNLTAMSGETASFLAGGEFPIPVSQALGVISIEFKPYGIGLNFVPTVMAPNHISLKVRPEVSQITTQGAITLQGIQIPALTVRRAETTIELGSGQSFAIAGLLQDTTSNDIQRFPGLGDLPVLGTLFRSTSFQRNESELLIVVTPYIVNPISDPKAIRLPTDSWQAANDVERIILGVPSEPNPPVRNGQGGAATPHLMGTAGFEVE